MLTAETPSLETADVVRTFSSCHSLTIFQEVCIILPYITWAGKSPSVVSTSYQASYLMLVFLSPISSVLGVEGLRPL